MNGLSHRLATLSASEMVAALGVRRAPELLRKGLALPFYLASRTLTASSQSIYAATP